MPNDVGSRRESSVPLRPLATSAARLEALLDAWTTGRPGGAVVATSRGRGDHPMLVAAGRSGPDGRPMAVEDRFRVGSLTKTFVATMVLQLVDEGALAPDDLVTWHAPQLTVAEGVTVRQLLGHASGIPDFFEDPTYRRLIQEEPARRWRPDEVIGLVAHRDRDFPPGELGAYSSTNYLLAGLLLEAVTHRSLAENLRRRVVGPLRLRDTFLPPLAGRAPIAGFSCSLPGGVSTAVPYRARETSLGAAGGLVSTAGDLSTFLTGLLRGRLLSPRSFAAMLAGAGGGASSFGLGVFPTQLPSGSGFGHLGGTAGFVAYMVAEPLSGDRLVVLINEDGDGPADLLQAVVSWWSRPRSSRTSSRAATPA
jgi:D-alanyl-D-alanine carboxypeptidase